MKILVVEDEKLARESLISVLQKVRPDAEVYGCKRAVEGLEYVKEHSCDVAFLDIEMRGMSGIDLAENLRDIKPNINIIFTTGYDEYTGEAIQMHASGYILKPVTAEKVARELSDLRHPVTEPMRRMRLQTFGNFEAFYDDEPIRFTYAKTKELFAYLVDRNGAMCTNQEIIAALWEEEGFDEGNHESYLKNIRSDLITTLESIGCGDILIRRRGAIGIVPNLVYCDYYCYLAGVKEVRRLYRGEYMSQYSWAEVTHAALDADLAKN
ncbi:MAG: response regulator [Lachnospiraceae bacterium]|nr:response regulator [Lachnospiraceae bacterium]MBP3735448.1 response regulator [Lachnospiraceae bacterium]